MLHVHVAPPPGLHIAQGERSHTSSDRERSPVRSFRRAGQACFLRGKQSGGKCQARHSMPFPWRNVLGGMSHMSNTCGPKQHKNVLAQCWRSGCGKQTAVEWYVAADWRSGSVLDGGCRAHGCRAYMELSGNTARDNNSKDTISPRHIYLAIENDEEIHRCLANVVIRDGGVLPNISASCCHLLPHQSALSAKSPVSTKAKQNGPR